MRVKNNIATWVPVMLLIVAIAGCGRPEAYGEKISSRSITEISDILVHPEKYNQKTVIVEGKIINECSTGCWFNLKQNGAVIYVDVEPSGFAIPQKVNRSVTVEGKISVEGGKPILTGKGVEIR